MSSRPLPLVAAATDRALSGYPHYQPRNVRVAANAPRMRGVSAVASFGQGTDPQQVPL